MKPKAPPTLEERIAKANGLEMREILKEAPEARELVLAEIARRVAMREKSLLQMAGLL